MTKFRRTNFLKIYKKYLTNKEVLSGRNQGRVKQKYLPTFGSPKYCCNIRVQFKNKQV
jgi:hypothetical protein